MVDANSPPDQFFVADALLILKGVMHSQGVEIRNPATSMKSLVRARPWGVLRTVSPTDPTSWRLVVGCVDWEGW